MATVEHEQPIRRGPARPREHHVFVSASGHRQSAVRAAGLVAGALALVWLVALGLALAGNRRLPGLPVTDPKPVAARGASGASTPTPASRHSRRLAQATRTRTETPQSHESRRAAAPTSTAPAKAPIAGIPPAPRGAPVGVTTPTTLTAASPTHGWARRGWTAPPGTTKINDPTPRGTGPSTNAGTTSTTHGNGHGSG
jgi:hypothetical protein